MVRILDQSLENVLGSVKNWITLENYFGYGSWKSAIRTPLLGIAALITVISTAFATQPQVHFLIFHWAGFYLGQNLSKSVMRIEATLRYNSRGWRHARDWRHAASTWSHHERTWSRPSGKSRDNFKMAVR